MTEALTSTGSSFGGLILVKSTVLLGLVFVLALIARRSSASTQHYLWTLGFVALLALPVVSYLAVAHEAWRITLPVPVLPSSEPSTRPVGHDTSLEPSPRRPGDTSAPGAAVPPRSHRVPESALTGPSMAYGVWLLGSGALLARLLAGIAASRRLRRESVVIRDERWLGLLGEAQARIGALSSVELRQTDRSPLPMTIGVLEPTILLPETAGSYPEGRRRAVLLHELAHVRRHDCLTQLLGQTACAIFWWHPLAWLGARRMRALSERASDDLVLDAGARPSDYAHDLLDMARGLSPRGGIAPLASVTMAHRSRLEDRLLAILDPEVTRRELPSRVAIPAALLGGAVLASVALAVPTAVAVSGQEVEAREPVARGSESRGERRAPEPEPDGESSEEPPIEGEATARATAPEGEQEAEPERTDAQERARAALAQALDDPNPSVREEAMGALVRLGDERAVPLLVEALDSDDAGARAEAAWGLGKMRREEAAPELIGALSDESDHVREQAAWSLGVLESSEAVEALGLVVMQDRWSNAREQAAWALGKIRSAEAVEALVAAILDENENVRSQAAWALGMIRDRRALPGLSKALQDDVVDVRGQAIWAIGMLRSPESLDVLVNALGDASPEIRSQAAWALGVLGDGRAIDALSAALRDDDPDVREQAAWALGKLAKDGDGGGDIDLDVQMDVEMEIELDNVNPNSNSNSNSNPNPDSDL